HRHRALPRPRGHRRRRLFQRCARRGGGAGGDRGRAPRRGAGTFDRTRGGRRMTHPDLASFVAHARERGLDPASIRLMLASAGWKDQEIAQALAAETLDLLIPAPPDSGGAREAFLHLLAFAAL